MEKHKKKTGVSERNVLRNRGGIDKPAAQTFSKEFPNTVLLQAQFVLAIA